MAGLLEGKVALITGTGGMQGRAAALRFTAEGALVVGCDVNAEANEETVRLVKEAGREMTAMAPVDLGDSSQARQWTNDAIAVHGRVDVLYNNASAARMPFIGDFTDDDWHYTINNELHLIFYVTTEAWPHLVKNGGVIINTASVQGKIGTAYSGGLAHAATKAAVSAMTRQMATEGAPHGIRAVSMSPGPIAAKAMLDQMPKEMLAPMMEKLLIQRFGDPDDVVNLAVFLASDQASYITGTDITIDGGMTTI